MTEERVMNLHRGDCWRRQEVGNRKQGYDQGGNKVVSERDWNEGLVSVAQNEPLVWGLGLELGWYKGLVLVGQNEQLVWENQGVKGVFLFWGAPYNREPSVVKARVRVGLERFFELGLG